MMRREKRTKEAEAYRKENIQELRKAEKLRGATGELASIRRKINEIKNDDRISETAKRVRTDALNKKMISVAQEAIGEEPKRKAVNQ
jgi:hypothetical protein